LCFTLADVDEDDPPSSFRRLEAWVKLARSSCVKRSARLPQNDSLHLYQETGKEIHVRRRMVFARDSHVFSSYMNQKSGQRVLATASFATERSINEEVPSLKLLESLG